MEIIRIGFVSSDERGCEEAPIEVLQALRKIGSSESGKEIDVDELNLEEIHVNLDDIEESNYLIFENSKEVFEKNSKVFFIGGDGSISYSIVKGFNKVQERSNRRNNQLTCPSTQNKHLTHLSPQKDSLLIVFDAHADCSECNDKFPDNRQWLRKLIEEGFSGERIILIGARDLGLDEREFLKESKVTLIGMDLLFEDIEEVCDLVMERARSSSGFYISIDVDVVDPAYCPAVNDVSAGGLSSRELIYFIKRLVILDNFRGADIVEINPSKDLNEMSVRLGAKLLGEII